MNKDKRSRRSTTNTKRKCINSRQDIYYNRSGDKRRSPNSVRAGKEGIDN